jgi:hypothetical protein
VAEYGVDEFLDGDVPFVVVVKGAKLAANAKLSGCDAPTLLL